MRQTLAGDAPRILLVAECEQADQSQTEQQRGRRRFRNADIDRGLADERRTLERQQLKTLHPIGIRIVNARGWGNDSGDGGREEAKHQVLRILQSLDGGGAADGDVGIIQVNHTRGRNIRKKTVEQLECVIRDGARAGNIGVEVIIPCRAESRARALQICTRRSRENARAIVGQRRIQVALLGFKPQRDRIGAIDDRGNRHRVVRIAGSVERGGWQTSKSGVGGSNRESERRRSRYDD